MLRGDGLEDLVEFSGRVTHACGFEHLEALTSVCVRACVHE